MQGSSNMMMMMMMMGGGGGGYGHGENNSNHTSNSNGGGNIMMMMPPPPSLNCDINNNIGGVDVDHNHTTTNTTTNLFVDPLPSSSSSNHHHHQITAASNNLNHGHAETLTSKIMSHPHYHRLLSSYVNCQKVGAPPEVVARLEETCRYNLASAGRGPGVNMNIGEDPGLDQFMEAYCEMLTKYEQELSKPFKEAMLFLSKIESQFKTLTLASSDSVSGVAMNRTTGSSEEEIDANNNFIDPQAEDRELKGQLLRKYSGYLGSLKHEFMKKRKKGKLPKEARQQLLDWWSRHYKWPYPSESQKVALAESTGLDQKQINNWFINQRKRHWKPSEDMQFVVMDAAHPHYYMDNVLGNPFPMDISPALL